MWLPSLLLLAGVALADEADPPVVVSFDNGGFNAPLYAPRWTGFARPSAAREIAASVARVAGESPVVYGYLPPGRTAGRPGVPHRVRPRRADCDGAADAPGDPCWCGPGDRCWSELAANRHPAGSTSLYLTAGALRAEHPGPRIEIHFTDLFEEDPSTAEDPADSDRCVTRSGVRRAVEGLLQTDEGGPDHLAVGLLRVRIDPPPPGEDVGSRFTFVEGEGGCWSGRRDGPWTAGSGPLDWAMAVVVLGVDTSAHSERVDAILDGLQVQLQTDQMALSLVRLREPPDAAEVDVAVEADVLADWSSAPSPRMSGLPCEAVDARATLAIDGHPVQPDAVSGNCAGVASLSISRRALQEAAVQATGWWPSAGEPRLEGVVELEGKQDAAVSAMDRLLAVNEEVGGRPLPFLDVLADLAHSDSGTLRTFSRRLELSIGVGGLTGPPWLWVTVIALLFGATGAMAVNRALLRASARRAYQAAWDRSVGAEDDPLRQRPVASILAEAQQDVRAARLGRWSVTLLVAAGVGVGVALVVLQLWVLTVV